jgi:hypothetical protein
VPVLLRDPQRVLADHQIPAHARVPRVETLALTSLHHELQSSPPSEPLAVS